MSSTKRRETIQFNINTANYVKGTNRFVYTFPSPLDLTNNNPSFGLTSYSVYNSTYNISASLGNNTYTITWVDGTVATFIIPDGYYSFSDLDVNLQYNLATKGWYIVSTSNSTQIQNFIQFTTNSVQYKAQINIFYVPKNMPTGYSLPSGATWSLPSVNTYPQITLCPGLQTLFGLPNQATYPSTLTGSKNLSFTSTTYPVLSPVFCYVLGCNMINNSVSNNPTIFTQIALTASYGSLISQNLNNARMLSVQSGKYSKLEITVYDQNLNPLVLVDPEMSITVMIEFDA